MLKIPRNDIVAGFQNRNRNVEAILSGLSSWLK
jgi:hypothetical protein